MRQEQIAEEARLKKTLDEINRQLQVRYKDKRNFEKNMRETYRNMWEEVEGAPTNLHDLEQLVQAKMYLDEMRNMESAFKGSARKIQYLEKMRDNPYFGRIDFKEDGESEPEQIYIGISTLQNENSLEIFVYDWRAPISSMFYDYEPGKVQYSSPSGTIKGELHLKRQYRIKNGRMEYMFDSDIKIDDDILQEILGQSKDEKMKSIVTTIQREQNRAIRDEEHRLLIVEGPAGSGKTSVALHRIAFLLYRYRNSLNSSNVVIFSPNDMFNDYISEVLPELGEENVRQTTFMEYAKSSLKTNQKVFGLNQQMEFILSHKNSLFYRDIIETIRFKSSLEFLYILKKYIDLLYKNPGKFEDFSIKNKTIISAAEQVELFHKEFAYLPFIPRLIKIRNRILYQIKRSEGERITKLLKKYESHPEWSDLKPIERKKRVTRIVCCYKWYRYKGRSN
jgi:DNA helicase-2/ATP-dependent DNA helicase PcrA